GVSVTFTAPPSGASSTFAGGLPVFTTTTNASGIATTPILTANNLAGSYSITASVAGAGNASFNLTNTAGPASSVTVFSGSPQTTTMGSSFGSALQAKVTDAAS